MPTFRTCTSFLGHPFIGNSTAAGAGLPTGLAVPVLETGSPGPAGFATGFAVPVLATGSTATGLAVPVLETGKGGGKAGAGLRTGESNGLI